MTDTGDRQTYRELALQMQIVRTWISAMKGVVIVHPIDKEMFSAACDLERLIDVGSGDEN